MDTDIRNRAEQLARECDELAAKAGDYYSEQAISQAAADLWDVVAHLTAKEPVHTRPGGIIKRG